MTTTNTEVGGPEEQSVTERAKEGASRVAGSARQEAGDLFEETRHQSRALLTEAKDRAIEEARRQAGHTAENLRSMSSELHSMAESSDAPQGTAASWVRMGADEIASFATRLEGEGIEGVMRDVGNFARRRPTAFLAVTFGAGLLAGRLVKNMDTEKMKEAGREAISGSDTGAVAQTRPEASEGSIGPDNAESDKPTQSEAGK